ncbi:hypothetical protein A2810_02160 [candidate division Kazan bacterium RIFCSPHIGHO2_01_FULL_49_10]|uniref:NTP pyrophosphohydrolase MazG putative catalytic core domain-containing protein n=1 Tax=candidate division Kazan bacterium RIFCSPLOWO2_01_FULL_48_13 TaxID=1798539 RepID=A0A1F4PPK0_UNCK3|nr:MAG: hypothetical protein A2810_02160 [candidate division Kazan bacterium RIFCSPHIGHO2_01_FULL_49_10]OGB84982.1 MAG: hypothetical protein A2994_01345 [candidate division Kazan bacterium RIFCSPLOWO2_01_FULL_48_13]
MDKSFVEDGSIADYQQLMHEIYDLPGDRNFSMSDILAQQQRFTMRALKGIRKGDLRRLRLNLLDAFSWSMTVVNRMHFNIEEILWRRFPYLCSYCGACPCVCKIQKPSHRLEPPINESKRPPTLRDFQKMFSEIYPGSGRTLADAGVHWAEETGEMSEAIHAYIHEHRPEQLKNIAAEMADFVSCTFGVANSAGIDVAKGLAELFYKNCLACHHLPCTCPVEYINKFDFEKLPEFAPVQEQTAIQ